MNEIPRMLVDELTIPDYHRIANLANGVRRTVFMENEWPQPPDLTPGDVRIVLRAWAQPDWRMAHE